MSPNPPDSRPGVLTERDIAILERLRGASVNVSDPRLTQLQSWLIGLVGTGIVGGLLMLSSSVIELRAEVAQWRDRWQTLEDHEQRLRQLERRP